MALDVDQEILQDFLVETGEILEELSEQLVELEQSPRDLDLLNAVFRGFHTIKGGASFLSLTALVDVCHVAEDVFNRLRNQEIVVDQNLMDVVLRVVDSVHDMIAEVQQDNEPSPAPLDLIEHLKELASDSVEEPVAEEPEETTIEDTEVADLDVSVTERIDDDEFEKVLDKLHGPGVGPSSAHSQASNTPTNQIEPVEDSDPNQNPISNFSDDEFENVLDSLYGEGKGPSTGAALTEST
ncbi:MAG TPA: chemotaxis protein CheA, partial [Gammaproteobacteria bacterium]|nr:chemotaxis protein CheA [Gammaproteobacteria bacterium]